ncbi:hypothetical protein CHS0354_003896 [Potamilus streckersoni]|uniref:Uncharacterized protein n=1 Tax=Potamilus streckersoni TaxID=2493646 RepID=A0AAE0TEM8_9BIVA|nr:hypothetical protein CHS0354_003896 [Potamilus streckersoni]
MQFSYVAGPLQRMEDIDVLNRIAQEIQTIETLPHLSDEYEEIKEFEENAASKIAHALETTQNIASYGENILARLGELRLKLNESTERTKAKMRGILHLDREQGNG